MIGNRVYLDPRARRYIVEHGIDMHRINKKWPDHDQLTLSLSRRITDEFNARFSQTIGREDVFLWLGQPKLVLHDLAASNAYERIGKLVKVHKPTNSIELQAVAFDAYALEPESAPEKLADVLFCFTLQTLYFHALAQKNQAISLLLKDLMQSQPQASFLTVFEHWKPTASKRSMLDLTLVFAIGSDYLGSDSDLKLRHAIEAQLDAYLVEHALGEVDGGSIGNGSMEVFVTVSCGLRKARELIQAFLRERSFPSPTKITVDE